MVRMNKKAGITKINIACSVLLQFTVIAGGIVIPRIILTLFGSEVNGLVSSVNQFLNYIQLVEGGLGGVVMAALYKPLHDKDMKSVSEIYCHSAHFFRQIGFIYIAYLVILAIVYPLLVNTGFGYFYSVALIIVLGVNLAVQYFLSVSYRLLLNADRKVYVVTLIQSVINILNVASAVFCFYFFKDLLFIKIISALIFLIQPVVFSVYVKKHYPIENNLPLKKGVLSQRWVAFGNNFAYFVHRNTDIVVLTVFSTLSTVSVYSVYMMVVIALRGVIEAVSTAFVPSFGKALAGGDREELAKTFDIYEFVVQISSYVLFSCCLILIVPFVMIYTMGINDADYYQPVFAVLIVIAEFICGIREPFIRAASAAAMFKKVAPHAFIEAALNIMISLILIGKYGIAGVAVGTIVAMVYRMIAQMVLVGKGILHRSMAKSALRTVVLVIVLLGTYFLFGWFGPNGIESIGTWLVYAVITFVIQCIVAALLGMILYRNAMMSCLKKREK